MGQLQAGVLCHETDVPNGQALGGCPDEDGQDRVFVVRHREALHAWRNACPHVPGAPMAWKRHAYLSPDGTQIMCHAHGARFEPDTGLCVQGPCRGAYLQRVDVTVDETGWVRLASPKQQQ